MNTQKANTVLIIMIAAAVLFFAIGLLVVRSRIKAPTSQQSQETQTTTQASNQTPQATGVGPNWLTYTNTKYNYQVKYPPQLKAGSISSNSVLGTAQNPVKGYHVGPLVFVTLKAGLRQQGLDYIKELLTTTAAPSDTGPSVACQQDNIHNPNVKLESVSCTGEGGAARYALITGTDYDLFVDGYSKGFDNQDNGTLADTDYANILTSFSFASSSTQATSNSTQTTSPNNTPNTPVTPAVQSFTITADDSGATPTSITVPSGTIVDLTFNVSSTNVYHGGLDFRSSVINSGTIYAGTSKTIAFTAQQSFSFTPYWPASNIAKPYTIQVIVQ